MTMYRRKSSSERRPGSRSPDETWCRRNLNGYVRDILLDGTAESARILLTNLPWSAGLLARFEAGEKLAKEVFSLVTLELWPGDLSTARS